MALNPTTVGSIAFNAVVIVIAGIFLILRTKKSSRSDAKKSSRFEKSFIWTVVLILVNQSLTLITQIIGYNTTKNFNFDSKQDSDGSQGDGGINAISILEIVSSIAYWIVLGLLVDGLIGRYNSFVIAISNPSVQLRAKSNDSDISGQEGSQTNKRAKPQLPVVVATADQNNNKDGKLGKGGISNLHRGVNFIVKSVGWLLSLSSCITFIISTVVSPTTTIMVTIHSILCPIAIFFVLVVDTVINFKMTKFTLYTGYLQQNEETALVCLMFLVVVFDVAYAIIFDMVDVDVERITSCMVMLDVLVSYYLSYKCYTLVSEINMIVTFDGATSSEDPVSGLESSVSTPNKLNGDNKKNGVKASPAGQSE